MQRLLFLLSMFFLTACTPPNPPVVNGYNRQPINNQETTEVLKLRAELAAAKEQLRVVTAPAPLKLSVQFPFNDTQFNPSPSQKAYLLSIIKDARHIVIRGRTDASKYSHGDERIALNRALSAKQFLINCGVSPEIITINSLSSGNYVGDNSSEEGRAQNRRVDIEVFPK